MKKITDALMETIATYMDDGIREQVHFELAPCSNEEFLKRYLELDEGFKELLHSEFNIELEENLFYFSEDNRSDCPELMDRTFTQSQLIEVYRDIVDRTEYPYFDCWLIDMLKSGLVMEK